jgi:hypothetical protein
MTIGPRDSTILLKVSCSIHGGMPRAMQGKTWKGASLANLERVRGLLVRRGGTEDKDLRNPSELWRIRLERVVFTAYRSGTLYCNGGSIPELPFLYQSISETLGFQ